MTSLTQVAERPLTSSHHSPVVRGAVIGDAVIRGAVVQVSIEYCEPGNLYRPAKELARALNSETGAVSKLRPGCGGAFEVRVNGQTVFSKRATYRLPEADEILYHVHAAAKS